MLKKSALVFLCLIQLFLFASENLEEIQSVTERYLDKAWKAGLGSPYEHSITDETWPERFVEELTDYSKFRSGFRYLFNWSDFYFSDSIARKTKELEEFQIQARTPNLEDQKHYL